MSTAATDHVGDFADLLRTLHRQSVPASRVLDHLERLDMHELYAFASRYPETLRKGTDRCH